jgi:hypothetical protein
MMNDQVSFAIITERPIVRNDQISDFDVAVDLITTKGVAAQRANLGLNLCVVIDRSGSMSGEKLDQAKRSCVEIFESLNSTDKLSVIAFDSEVISVVNPQTPRNQVKDRLLALTPGGQTNLSKGWYLGLLELQTYATDQHLNRLVLLSDGQANEGEQKPSVLGAESGRARDELGITTSTIGIGKDFQEDILKTIARESGGRFWFIGEELIEDIIREEFSGALSVFLERPKVEVSLPAGIGILSELNDLPKQSGLYRLRPIKGNDRFCFAMRLRVDPANGTSDQMLTLGATLLDGAGIVCRAETTLRFGSVEEYAQSPIDERVALVVEKHLAATTDEKIIARMDAGDVTEMLEMIREHSDLCQNLEAKLAGAKPISWETMTEREALEAKLQIQKREQELDRLRMEIEENTALLAVGELIDLLRGIGQQEQAAQLLQYARKHHHQRGARDGAWDIRGTSDDWAVRTLLEAALDATDRLFEANPTLREEIANIRERLNEQLARFS